MRMGTSTRKGNDAGRPDHIAAARAFDAVAPGYDDAYGPGGNSVMTWMRHESLSLLERAFPPGALLLEIGCGTGDEALHLARGGRTVLATDVSPGMAARTQAKARAAGLSDRVVALALPAGRLSALSGTGAFDGAYASFGGLNCEPDLPGAAAALARLLRPGSAFVCSVMARWCAFEIAWFLARARPTLAFRRLRRGWQAAPVAGSEGPAVTVPVRYLSARDVSRAFAVERALALPLLLPPPYLDGLFRQRRSLFARLERWDRRLRERPPWRNWGDHVVVMLRRR